MKVHSAVVSTNTTVVQMKQNTKLPPLDIENTASSLLVRLMYPEKCHDSQNRTFKLTFQKAALLQG